MRELLREVLLGLLGRCLVCFLVTATNLDCLHRMMHRICEKGMLPAICVSVVFALTSPNKATCFHIKLEEAPLRDSSAKFPGPRLLPFASSPGVLLLNRTEDRDITVELPLIPPIA